MLLPLAFGSKRDFNHHNRLARKSVTMSLSLSLSEKDLFSHFSFGHFEMGPRVDGAAS
jgi:hypothetical protein